MLPDNLDLNIATEGRRNAIKESIRVVTLDQMKTLEEEIFPFKQDIWHDRFDNFMKENAGGTFFYAVTDDPVEIVYCHCKERGIWFQPSRCVGILHEPALKVLKEIVEEAHLVPTPGASH